MFVYMMWLKPDVAVIDVISCPHLVDNMSINKNSFVLKLGIGVKYLTGSLAKVTSHKETVYDKKP